MVQLDLNGRIVTAYRNEHIRNGLVRAKHNFLGIFPISLRTLKINQARCGWSVEEGLHSIIIKEISKIKRMYASWFTSGIIEATIPKGAWYMKNEESYVSTKLIYDLSTYKSFKNNLNLAFPKFFITFRC